MRKKLLIGFAGVILLAAAICVTLSVNADDVTSGLMTKNIEALTNGDEGSNLSVIFRKTKSRFI